MLKGLSPNFASRGEYSLKGNILFSPSKGEYVIPPFKGYSSFMTEVPIVEISPLICSASQRTGFYMIGTSVMKELIEKAKFDNDPLPSFSFLPDTH